MKFDVYFSGTVGEWTLVEKDIYCLLWWHLILGNWDESRGERGKEMSFDTFIGVGDEKWCDESLLMVIFGVTDK